MEQQQYSEQELALMQQALQNSGMYGQQAGTANLLSSREFYLEYDNLLDELKASWLGLKKHEGEWVKDDKGSALMNTEAANIITSMIRKFLSVPSRLAYQEDKDVRNYAFLARKHVSKFLHTLGWQEYKIPIEHLQRISFETGFLVHAALTWSRNARGMSFITTHSKSIEHVTQSISEIEQKKSKSDDQNQYDPKTKLW